MGMSPREIEEKEIARRRKIRKRYYWSGMELRPKKFIGAVTAGKIRDLLRRLPETMRSRY
ncbi:hypothetical protein Psch_03357 [Pelotomaculum schinkii]|uniref:Uncharacterized protein n=1 Tax=Pelotomaculum schinkii TaxID=78350 RepID=A0A4Y7R757_9FIRM|nr:hypothetical protein [Pelotomaculum schinkii]TEB04596.1 hypothetical protein Psch_03357 [Pelotomaculum schinkii]